MKQFYLLILILLLGLLSACGLRRKNPIDPYGNSEILVPDVVINFEGIVQGTPGSTDKLVNFTWTANNAFSTDGYYLYRSMSYNSSYARIDTVTTNLCSHGAKPWHNVTPGEYWYRVSAWKNYNDRRLEGPYSDRIHIRVNP